MEDIENLGDMGDMEKRRPLPEAPLCAGDIQKHYCRKCSDECPYTAACVLILMSELLRKKHV